MRGYVDQARASPSAAVCSARRHSAHHYAPAARPTHVDPVYAASPLSCAHGWCDGCARTCACVAERCMGADCGCGCRAVPCCITPLCALTSACAGCAACCDGCSRTEATATHRPSHVLRYISPNRMHVTADAACSAPVPRRNSSEVHHCGRPHTELTSSAACVPEKSPRRHRVQESARRRCSARRRSPTYIDAAEPGALATSAERPHLHPDAHRASPQHTQHRRDSRHRGHPSRTLSPTPPHTCPAPAPTTHPSSASSSRVQRLLQRLEDVATASGATPQDSSAAEVAQLYQALFLQALADGAAWERRARALEAEAAAAARRERRLARHARRMQTAVELLVAYVEGTGRNTELRETDDHGATRSPERVDVSCSHRGPTTNPRTAAAAAAAASPAVPLRAASHSAVSDLIRGSLGRSLDLAYSRSRSCSDSSDGDEVARRLPCDAQEEMFAEDDAHAPAYTVSDEGRAPTTASGHCQLPPAPPLPRTSVPPDAAPDPAAASAWGGGWLVTTAAPATSPGLRTAPHPTDDDDDSNSGDHDSVLAADDAAAAARARRRHATRTHVDDTPIRAAWRDASGGALPPPHHHPYHHTPPHRASTQARGSPMTAASPAPTSASTATQIGTAEGGTCTPSLTGLASRVARRSGGQRGGARRNPYRPRSPPPLPPRLPAQSLPTTAASDVSARVHPPALPDAAHAAARAGEEAARRHSSIDSGGTGGSHRDDGDGNGRPDDAPTSAVHSLLELLRSRDTSSGRRTPTPQPRAASPVAGLHLLRPSSGSSAASRSSRASPAAAVPPRGPRPLPLAPSSLSAHRDVDYEVTMTGRRGEEGEEEEAGVEESGGSGGHARRLSMFEKSSSTTAKTRTSSSSDPSQTAVLTPSRSPIPCRSFHYRALHRSGGGGGEGSASHAASLPSWTSSSSPPSHAAALAPPPPPPPLPATTSSSSRPSSPLSPSPAQHDTEDAEHPPPSPQPTALVRSSSGESGSRFSSAAAHSRAASVQAAAAAATPPAARVRTAASFSASSSSAPRRASPGTDEHKLRQRHPQVADPPHCPVPHLPLLRVREVQRADTKESSNSSSSSDGDDSGSAASTSNEWESVESTAFSYAEAASQATGGATHRSAPPRDPPPAAPAQEAPSSSAQGDSAGYAQWRAALEAQLHESYATGDGAA